MFVRNKRSCEAIDSGHGEVLYELLGREIGGAEKHSLVYVELLPGSSSQKHFHPQVEESYYVLDGEARIEINGESDVLKPGDVVVIPPKSTHQVFNDGDKPFCFVAICVPPWTPDCSIYS